MKSIVFQQHTLYPGKIICVGRNYVEHIQELNNEIPEEPVLFIKPNSAIADKLYTDASSSIHYEGEICFLIQQGKFSAVGFGFDLTKRDLQSKLKSKGLPWERAKAFNASAVFSEFVSFSGECSTLRMELRINDQLIQQASYELMIHKPQKLFDEITKVFSWEDGDILMTGTPKGVGSVKVGDCFNAKLFDGEKEIISAEWIAKQR